MRTAILISLSLALGSLVYATKGSREPRPAPPAAGAEPASEAKGAGSLQREIMRELLTQRPIDEDAQAALSARVAEIEARLSDVGTEKKNLDDEAPKGAPAAPGRISEAALGQWLDEALDREAPDPVRSDQITRELGESLKSVPDVRLEGVDCGARFCRASFSRDDSARPKLTALYGSPPVTTEAFTLDAPDGRVTLYLTTTGESLSRLRGEATGVLPPNGNAVDGPALAGKDPQ
jgi:hypothetical protein